MPQKKLKGKSTAKDKDGQHRKETKEERKARLQRQQEAREVRFQCRENGLLTWPYRYLTVSFSFCSHNL
jgi:hypothetical protein